MYAESGAGHWQFRGGSMYSKGIVSINPDFGGVISAVFEFFIADVTIP